MTGMNVPTSCTPPPTPSARKTTAHCGSPAAVSSCRGRFDEEGGAGEVEEVDEGGADVDGEHEHQVHHAEEDGKRQEAVQHHRIDPFGEGAPDRRGREAILEQPVDGGVAGFGACRRWVPRRFPVAGAGHDGVLQRIDSIVVRGDQRNHRASEPFSEGKGIDVAAVLAGDIHHVERHHERLAALKQFEGQVKAPGEARGIDHVDQYVGGAVVDVLLHDALVDGLTGRVHAIGAGQVLHLKGSAAVAITPGLALDGDAGPVADPLTGTGQAVEEGGFPAIRIADQRNGGHSFSSSRQSASSGRSVSENPRNPISIGSPSGARRLTSKRVPGMSPRRSRS